MKPILPGFPLLLVAVLVGSDAVAGGIAGSASSAGSSAASAGSASLRGSSDALSASSNSSDSGDGQQARIEGDYRVAAIEPVVDAQVATQAGVRPASGALRLRLEPVGDGEQRASFDLTLPQAALAARPLAAGDLVAARARPFGLEFAHADTRTPFFLVLADDWQREMQSRRLN